MSPVITHARPVVEVVTNVPSLRRAWCDGFDPFFQVAVHQVGGTDVERAVSFLVGTVVEDASQVFVRLFDRPVAPIRVVKQRLIRSCAARGTSEANVKIALRLIPCPGSEIERDGQIRSMRPRSLGRLPAKNRPMATINARVLLAYRKFSTSPLVRLDHSLEF